MPTSQNNVKTKSKSKSKHTSEPSQTTHSKTDRKKQKVTPQPAENKRLKQIDKQSIKDAQKQIVDKFNKDAYLNLLIDLYLLFGLILVLGTILFIIDELLGEIFFIFAFICSIIISRNYFIDLKAETEKVMKDIEVLLKYKS